MDKSKFAQIIFEGHFAHSHVEERLFKMFDSLPHHIGHDYYDQSLEVYFNPHTPEDFSTSLKQAEEILSWGFARCRFYFTDGTEQSFSVGIENGKALPNSVSIGKRKKIAHEPWTVEMASAMPSEF